MYNAKITGIASYVPDYKLTNDELSQMVDTNDEWITTRVGIKERRILKGEGLGSSYMGKIAVDRLMESTGANRDEIDLVICATSNPDYRFPSTASIIAHKCELNHCYAYDIQAACAGFIVALQAATAYVRSGMYKKVVVVAAEMMSSMTNYEDRTTCPLFGDAAAAILLEPTEEPNVGVIDGVFHVDGEGLPHLVMKAGGSAYPRQIDFARFRQIADDCGAYLMVDMAHFAGLVAGGVHPNPLGFADVVTTTTHKTLRGPRGGMILTNNPDLAKKIDSAVFPGMQGGPLEHVVAAKAVCFKEALSAEFQDYARQVVANAAVLGKVLQSRGLDLVSGGTDTHLLLVDLRPKGLTGDVVSQKLEAAGMTCNKNAIPFDPLPPKVTSGIRLGTPAGTTRGFKEKEFTLIGGWIGDVVDALAAGDADGVIAATREKVRQLCLQFPIY